MCGVFAETATSRDKKMTAFARKLPSQPFDSVFGLPLVPSCIVFGSVHVIVCLFELVLVIHDERATLPYPTALTAYTVFFDLPVSILTSLSMMVGILYKRHVLLFPLLLCMLPHTIINTVVTFVYEEHVDVYIFGIWLVLGM